MIVPTTIKQQNFSSDQPDAPFIGKYHFLLRNRNQSNNMDLKSQKKLYKRKKIFEKTMFSIYQQWKLEMPLGQIHVYNFCNILAINQNSMRNPQYEESFISSKFYMKKVKKATIHKDALLLTLEDMKHDVTPIAYICQRFKSFGDQLFFEIAQILLFLEQTLPEINSKLQNDNVKNEENQVFEFVKQMSGKLYFSQFYPHMLIISNSLLELLGYNVQQFALECIKYKSILTEFFSAKHYARVIYKHLQNMKLLISYMQGDMALDQFCSNSQIQYTDFVYNRVHHKIRCHFLAGSSKLLNPYIEVKKIIDQQYQISPITVHMNQRIRSIKPFYESHRMKQINLLSKLIHLPSHLIPENKERICSYKIVEQGQSKYIGPVDD